MKKVNIGKKSGFIPHHFSTKKSGAGFTLIELLLVVAIIAILAGATFVALDPLERFQDTRDATRSADVTEILSAAKLDQVDREGSYLPAIAGTTAGDVYMIGTDVAACDAQNADCGTNVTSALHCVDLTALDTGGYLGGVPVSPDGTGAWTSGITGYTLQRDATGILRIRACEAENTTDISASR
jgi:prepilin-type N-terminal cleavage/methylation domain-containing protein